MSQSELVLSLGAVVVEDPTLWGWDSDFEHALATGTPEKRRVKYECADGQIGQLGVLSLTIETPMVQTEGGLFRPAGSVRYPIADEMIVTLINPGWTEIPGLRPKANYRRSRR